MPTVSRKKLRPADQLPDLAAGHLQGPVRTVTQRTDHLLSLVSRFKQTWRRRYRVGRCDTRPMAGELRERLAEGLEGDARRARLALVDDLRAHGCSDDELVEAHAHDRLALLPLDRLLRAEGTRTVAQIAADHGVDAADLIATRRALGLPVDTE